MEQICSKLFSTIILTHVYFLYKELYEIKYGFSRDFSDYVEKYVLKFDEYHDKSKENMWIAEVNGKPVGVIAVIKANDDTAQLRWFLIEPEARGKRIGHKLMQTLIDFCKENGYKHIFLWTANILKAARHIYKTYGFGLRESVENNSWTEDVVYEERWDLDL